MAIKLAIAGGLVALVAASVVLMAQLSSEEPEELDQSAVPATIDNPLVKSTPSTQQVPDGDEPAGETDSGPSDESESPPAAQDPNRPSDRTIWDLLAQALDDVQKGSMVNALAVAEVSGPAYHFFPNGSGQCVLLNTEKGVHFTASFKDRGPTFSIVDNAAGTVSGGFAINGEEWQWGRPGKIELTGGLDTSDVVKDLDDDNPHGDYVLDANPSSAQLATTLGPANALIVFASWAGTAGENLSGEKADLAVNAQCMFVPTWVVERVGAKPLAELSIQVGQESLPFNAPTTAP